MAILNNCNCVVVISDPGNPVSSCDDCLKVYSLRIPCDTGPYPCGGVDGTVVIDLADYNDVTACDCGDPVVYSVFSFDATGITSATVTGVGVLTIVTNSTFVDHEEYEVMYKVDCPCNDLSAYGSVMVCKQNLCAGVTCGELEECDECTGDCIPIP